jgi:acyl carrier protein
MSETEIQNALCDFIVKQFPAFHGKGLEADDSLLEAGVIDSMGVLEIVTFIENELNVVLTDDEMVAENFGSVRALTELITGRSAHSG